ncbi:MAG: DUF2157 domain-containing protein [Gemmataceae bacterium]|nr:DUF2157 domain-containing protein [Gemmataceae bacterium]
MEKRPLTPTMRQWLLDQMKHWREQNLVSDDQAETILDLYETPRQSSSRQQSVAIFVLLGVAALLVGMAVFLLIGYNWNAIPAPLKLIIVIGTVMGTYAVAFYLRYWRDARILSEIVFFLGAIFYGASIWLIAQIFHLSAHYPDGFWWWAAGIFPIALCLDTILLHMLVNVILAVWVGTEILGFAHMGFWFFGRFGMLPNGCYTLPVFASIGLTWAYHKNSPFTAALYVPLIVWWALLQPFSWHFRENPIFFIGSMGALLLLLAETHKEGSKFAIPYRLYGALLCMGVLSILGFYQAQQHMARFEDTGRFLIQTFLITLLAVIALAAAFVVQRRRDEMNNAYARLIYGFVVRQWLPVSMVALMFLMPIWYALLQGNRRGVVEPMFIGAVDPMIVLLPTILANIAMLALAFWLLLVGLREERAFPFTGAVLYFLLWALQRYIDLFSHAGGMLGASCMFFVTGAVIFGAAMFWYSHKSDAAVKSRIIEIQNNSSKTPDF